MAKKKKPVIKIPKLKKYKVKPFKVKVSTKGLKEYSSYFRRAK